MYKSLQDFVNTLDEREELIRIKKFVDPVLEITDVVDRISKQPGGGKALLFENTGTDFPVLINSMGSYNRICLALGVENLEDIRYEIEDLFKDFIAPKDNIFEKLKTLPKLKKLSSWMPKSIKRKGRCQEIIEKNPDITQLPVLKCWPEDGGRFITLPMVNTLDPVTGIRNVGMYRMQVFDKNLTGMHWHMHKVGARHFNEYKKLGKKMPVVVTLGGDPVYAYSATAPLPDNVDEYLLSGFLRKKRVELVKCITQDIYVPADVDFVIEGYVDPEEDFIWEGPFGDHTGFYSLADWYPKFHITCITHKKNAIYPATIVGIPPQEDAWIAKATERIFLAPIKMALLPEIKDIDIPVSGVAHNLTMVKIEKSFPGHAQKVMNALWGAGQMMLNKVLIVFDDDVDIHDYDEVIKTIARNVRPEDVLFSTGPLDVLDHAAPQMGLGGKMCIDATRKQKEKQIEVEYKIDKQVIIDKIPEIININEKLLEDKIPLLIVSVGGEGKRNIQELYQDLIKFKDVTLIKFIVFVNKELDLDNIGDIVWVAGNNIDPQRDVYMFDKEKDRFHIVLDSTRKIKGKGFLRDWPNTIASDKKTIERIDQIWEELGFKESILSPSLKYEKMLIGEGAIAKQ